jgi:lycopene cyclase domain-containing protein
LRNIDQADRVAIGKTDVIYATFMLEVNLSYIMMIKKLNIFKKTYLSIGILAFLLTIANFAENPVDISLINNNVNKFYKISFLENKNLYFLVHLIVIIPILLLSFDKKVNFVSKFKHILKGVLIVGFLFIVWDSLKTFTGVWTFNNNYVINIFIGNLPIEEYLFFLTIPIACVFIHQCILSYNIFNINYNDNILVSAIIFFLLVIGIYFWDLLYTSTVCLITTSVLCFHIVFGEAKDRIKTYHAYLFSILPFIAINGILTGGFTNSPIISYNEGEFLNLRLVSIPIEDAIYLFPLLLGNISFYELEKRRSTSNSRFAKAGL